MEMTNDDDDDEVASHLSLSPSFLLCPGRIQCSCCVVSTQVQDGRIQRWRLFCLAFGFVLLLLAPVTAAEVGLGDEIITNWEEKCFRPHSIWIVAWSWFLPVTSLFNVGQFNSCQFWAE
ncbi:uncharacterized protein LOC114266811 isoform X3 [Camellia sinensis]|uniref:uncharacterized protein LOC114266811 isoform X3 n=1 Tax=Camellia sinensis TaxID=4442 RepID=UPI001036D176|nr:uncharacterized protein LOC114266811 isoform X3 [Camellia sinensis]